MKMDDQMITNGGEVSMKGSDGGAPVSTSCKVRRRLTRARCCKVPYRYTSHKS